MAPFMFPGFPDFSISVRKDIGIGGNNSRDAVNRGVRIAPAVVEAGVSWEAYDILSIPI